MSVSFFSISNKGWIIKIVFRKERKKNLLIVYPSAS